MGIPSVKKNGLFNQPLPNDLRQEIYVFLCSRCTNGDVVEARYQGHVPLTSRAIISSVMATMRRSQYIKPAFCMQAEGQSDKCRLRAFAPQQEMGKPLGTGRLLV